MGNLRVGLRRRKELEHRHIELMLINARIGRQQPLFERIRIRRVPHGRAAGLELLSFVDIHISLIGNLSAPVIPPAV